MNLLLAFALPLCAAPLAHPTVLYTNVGEGDTVQDRVAQDLSFLGRAAFNFTVPADGPDYRLARVDIALASYLGVPPSPVILALHADGDSLPGPVLEAFTLSGLPFFAAPPLPLAGADSAAHPTLLAGGHYWLSAIPEPGGSAAWVINEVGDRGPEAFQLVGGPWTTLVTPKDGFRIVADPATPVPELGRAALVGLGLATLRLGRAGAGRVRRLGPSRLTEAATRRAKCD